MISQKTRNNASIAYFFLGWLFLLAGRNPNFADPFVRAHAGNASKGHAVFFLVYFLYEEFFSQFFSYSIPVIHITISHLIELAIFLGLTLFIISGAYRAQKSGDTEDRNEVRLFGHLGQTFEFQGASESQRMTLLLAHIPFFGMIISQKHSSTVATYGMRATSVFSLIYILIFIRTGFGSLATILLFAWIFFLVLLASRFFLSDKYTIPTIFERIPSMETIYLSLRAFPLYLVDVIQLILGKRNSLSLSQHLERIRVSDQNFRHSLGEYFQDTTLPVSPVWIYIPFCNIIFLPKMIASKTSQYSIAFGQGLIITLLALFIGFYYGFASPVELFLLFPVFYGISSPDPFVRIPGIYELYVIFNTLTFGFLRNKKRLEEVHNNNQNVSFKV